MYNLFSSGKTRPIMLSGHLLRVGAAIPEIFSINRCIGSQQEFDGDIFHIHMDVFDIR